MWHEARKQEKKLRVLMVDWKKRAERRREFYHRIKQDPVQFIRVYGRPCKIHLDPAVSVAAEAPNTMMPWQDDKSNMIDRFDVRAHLDMIPEYKPKAGDYVTDKEEQRCNYERYRPLVQNDGAGITEEMCLHQISLDEIYGAEKKNSDEEKKKLAASKAAIGYVYDDSTAPQPSDEDEDDSEEELGPADMDIDMSIDVDDLNEDQIKALNQFALNYGMVSTQYIDMLKRDKEEAEYMKRTREEEEEKAMYSGRKSRRERRALIEKRLRNKNISPPSYARRNSPDYEPYRRSLSKSSSRSRSNTPENSGKVEFITSFGGDQSPSQAFPKPSGTQATTTNTTTTTKSSPVSSYRRSRKSSSSSSSSSNSSVSSSRSSYSSSPSSRSRSRSCSRSRGQRSSQYHRRSRSRSHGRGHRRSRSRSWGRHRSRSWSRDRRYPSSSSSRRDSRHSTTSSLLSLSKASATGSGLLGKGPAAATATSSKQTPNAGLTQREKMKLRMQKALNRQHKEDKKKQIQKESAKEVERQEREDEIRNLSRKIRKKERERYDDSYYDDNSYRSYSRSPSPRKGRRSRSRTPPRHRRHHHRSRSRSSSPGRYKHREHRY